MLRSCSNVSRTVSSTAASASRAVACTPRGARCISATVSRRADVDDEPEAAVSRGRRWRSGKFMPISPSFEDWLEKEGPRFKSSTKPKNWLGGNVPFPLNPSFKPPTPLSDSLRTSIYTMHAADPANNNTRVLSEQFGLSIKRVEAILKLKALEDQWKTGKPLQTAFTSGMEHILGVQEDARARKAARAANELVDDRKAEINARGRVDVQAADLQSQDEGQQGLVDRGRYRRMYWESVSEAETPIVPLEVERARTEGKDRRESRIKAKSNPALLTGRADAKAVGDADRAAIHRSHSGQAPGRPGITFIDVGGKFMDVAKAEKRVKNAGTKHKR